MTTRISPNFRQQILCPQQVSVNTTLTGMDAYKVWTHVVVGTIIFTLPAAKAGAGPMYFCEQAANNVIVVQPQATDHIVGNGNGVAVTLNTVGAFLGLFCELNGTWSIISASPGVAGAGTVSSVGLAEGSIFNVTGSPVTTSGTLTLTLKAQAVNTVFAGPTSGGAAQPTFRALVAADVPSSILPGSFSGFAIPANKISLSVNAAGVATTALRSDCTIQLDVTIAPTWTGKHIFSGTINGANIVQWQDGTNTAAVFTQSAPNAVNFGTTTASELHWWANNASRVVIGTAGNVTINAPTSGVALSATGFAGSDTATIFGSGTSGQSKGLHVLAGTTVADYAVTIGNQAQTLNFLQIFGDGSGTLGPSATLGLSWNAAGNVIVAAPTSGRALLVNNASAQPGVEVSAASGLADGRSVMRFTASKTTVQQWDIGIDTGGGTNKSFEFRDITRNAIPLLINITGNIIAAAPTTGAALSLPAGTATVYPLLINSGVTLTTPAAGATEFDGTAAYFTPAASSRAVIGTEYVEVMSGTKTLVSQTAAQAILNGTTNGAVTLPIGTYEFDCFFSLTALSATSGAFGFALGGTATFTQAWWAIADKPTALATAATPQMTFDTAANTLIASAATGTVGYAQITGIIRVTVAGTVIPQVSQTTAAAAVVGANSFARFRPVGSATVQSVGNWS